MRQAGQRMRGKKRRRVYIFPAILFLFFFVFSIRTDAASNKHSKDGFGETLTAEESEDAFDEILSAEESGVDLDALTGRLRQLETELPDFSAVFQSVFELRFFDAAKLLAGWLFDNLVFELRSSWLLLGELLGVLLFSALFSNLSSSFQRFSIGESGFFIVYIVVFTILFSNFTIMTRLFVRTMELLSGLLKVVIPVYALTVTMTGHLTMGAVFYEYFMVIVLIINALSVSVILPLIQYYMLLELINNFSVGPNISRLCESLYLLLSKGMKLLFFLFFGFHLLEILVVPSVDATKNVLLNRLLGILPGAGSVVRSVAGAMAGSAILIKNTMGVSVILFLFCILAIPVAKLLLYCLLYLLLSIVIEPVADARFVRCMAAAQKSGWLLVCALFLGASLFVLAVAVTTLATNHV